MNPLTPEDHSEDELVIREHYQSFLVPDADQREAILDRWQTVCQRSNMASRWSASGTRND